MRLRLDCIRPLGQNSGLACELARGGADRRAEQVLQPRVQRQQFAQRLEQGVGRVVEVAFLLVAGEHPPAAVLIAVRRFAELSGRPPRQVLAWLLSTMRFRLMRYVRDHRAELAGEGPELRAVATTHTSSGKLTFTRMF